MVADLPRAYRRIAELEEELAEAVRTIETFRSINGGWYETISAAIDFVGAIEMLAPALMVILGQHMGYCRLRDYTKMLAEPVTPGRSSSSASC